MLKQPCCVQKRATLFPRNHTRICSHKKYLLALDAQNIHWQTHKFALSSMFLRLRPRKGALEFSRLACTITTCGVSLQTHSCSPSDVPTTIGCIAHDNCINVRQCSHIHTHANTSKNATHVHPQSNADAQKHT